MENVRQDIIDRERAFHNERFGQEQDPRMHLDKWYLSIRHGAESQDQFVKKMAKGADVLEYGCADGALSLGGLHLDDICRSLVGIDISDVAVATANEHARKAGASNAEFIAMNAEAMSFPDNSFDLVYGRGIIHHLDLDRCYSEVARILRNGGCASFFEPMGYNPVLNAYRNRTPDIRTVDEHPLLAADFTLAERYFAQVKVEYFGLFSVGSALVPKGLRSYAYSAGKAMDSIVLKVPYVNRLAWYALITLTKKSH